MLGENFLSLWSVLDGHPAPFKTIVHRDADVADLKDAIKEDEENALRDLDASSLVLWMVSTICRLMQDDMLLIPLSF